MFERYYPHDTYRDDFVKRLRDSLSKYQRLTEEARTVSARRDDLKARIEDDRSKIIPVLHHIGIRFVATINQHVVAIAFHKSCISLAYINIVNRKGGISGEHSIVIDIFR